MNSQLIIETHEEFQLDPILDAVNDGMIDVVVLDESLDSFSLQVQYENLEDYFDFCAALVRVMMEEGISEFKFSHR